jgi:transaldolase
MKPAQVLFLDSASIDDAAAAAAMGIVAGITTNPTLLAREGAPPGEQMRGLLDVFPGLVFYQPMSIVPAEARREIDGLMAVGGNRLVAKLPATEQMFALAAELMSRDGVPCAITAVYSEQQVVLAAAAGVDWVIPYVNRAKRLMEGGDGLVARLAAVSRTLSQRPRILAASVKSADEAVEALLHGSDGVSLPMDVLRSFSEHELSRSAIESFVEDGAALLGGGQGPEV